MLAWATHARDAGKAAASQTVEGEIFLRLKDPAGATALATAVSTPGSSQYRQWVTPQQWINRFSPPQSVYNGLLKYLRYNGLTITGTPDSRLFVVFRGTAAQVSQVFDTSLHSYSLAGKHLVAPSSAPSLPADIAVSVSGMELDQGRLLTRPDSVTPDAGSGTAAPSSASPNRAAPTTAECSNYYGEHQAKLPKAYGQTVFNTYICGYVFAQLRSAYGVSLTNPTVLTAGRSAAELDGSGQTVAIIDAYASPTIHQDVNTYSARRGEPALAKFSQIKPKTFYDQALCQEPSGWQGEQTLDVEAVHGIAPAAGVLYAKDGSVAVETGWGSHRAQVNSRGNGYVGGLPGDFRFGAGGGRSTIFAQPAYQQGIVPASLAHGMRVSPDIAADADPYTGMLIGLRPISNDTTLKTGSYVEEAIGGTSLASPLVAAQMALVQQAIGQTIGFANPALYALHKAVPSVPRDVVGTAPFPLAFTSAVTGNTYLVTGNRDTSLTVRPWYDDVTGLGAIDFQFLWRAMA